MVAARDLYIDLMKRSLKNVPYLDAERNPIMPRGRMRRLLIGACERVGVGLVHAGEGLAEPFQQAGQLIGH